MASYYRRSGLNLSCYFVEEQAKSFDRLQQVLADYASRGVHAFAHRGEVDDVLDHVVRRAAGVPLFLFLDPCGLCLPRRRLVNVLAQQRRERRPATELLMNFSMMAVRRLGGHVCSPKGNERSLERFDAVCGGTWWREYFADPTPHKDAAEAVAAEYARRLRGLTGMFVQSVPVKDAPNHKAVYHLVFATRSQYGLWVFGDALAQARNAWWETLELQDKHKDPYAIFTTTSVLRPDPAVVEKEAVPAIAANLEQLLRRGRPVKLVDSTMELFGAFYGQVTDAVARKAVRYLHDQGGTPTTGAGVRRNREIVVQPPVRR